jgi:DNA repair exonuclease SbcCD ATPase subunit
MMEDETRQLLIGLFRELKTDINGVKTDISAVAAGQEELGTKINAGQEELRQEISVFQERIKAGHAEFEERVTRNIEATRQAVEATRRDLEATQRDLETHLAALEARTRRAGGSSAGANTDKVKPPKFDGSTSWVVFQRQFEAAAIHNDWTPREKAAHFF